MGRWRFYKLTSTAFVARELAPAGLRSRPIFWGRYAPQREQAPSPQVYSASGCWLSPVVAVVPVRPMGLAVAITVVMIARPVASRAIAVTPMAVVARAGRRGLHDHHARWRLADDEGVGKYRRTRQRSPHQGNE